MDDLIYHVMHAVIQYTLVAIHIVRTARNFKGMKENEVVAVNRTVVRMNTYAPTATVDGAKGHTVEESDNVS